MELLTSALLCFSFLSGALSTPQDPPDTVLWLLEPYYAGAKVYAITTHIKASKISHTKGILSSSAPLWNNAWCVWLRKISPLQTGSFPASLLQKQTDHCRAPERDICLGWKILGHFWLDHFLVVKHWPAQTRLTRRVNLRNQLTSPQLCMLTDWSEPPATTNWRPAVTSEISSARSRSNLSQSQWAGPGLTGECLAQTTTTTPLSITGVAWPISP